VRFRRTRLVKVWTDQPFVLPGVAQNPLRAVLFVRRAHRDFHSFAACARCDAQVAHFGLCIYAGFCELSFLDHFNMEVPQVTSGGKKKDLLLGLFDDEEDPTTAALPQPEVFRSPAPR
jgi:hypothetical protein